MGVYIEIAIALVLTFLILSLIVTAVNELIAMQLKKRPAMLLKTIQGLFGAESDLMKRFYASGFVVGATPNAAAAKEPPSAAEHPSYIAGINFAKGLTKALLDADGSGKVALSDYTPDQLQKVVADLPQGRLRDVLVDALSDADQTMAGIQKRVADWYDSSMDRLSGDYARHQKWMALTIGLVLTVVLNVDALQLVRRLQTDSALRQNMVLMAEKVPAEQAGGACGATSAGSPERESCLVQRVRDLSVQLTPLPVGWGKGEVLMISPLAEPGAFLGGWAQKILGWLITALAITLGAPFWFDVLQRFVNIRGAGAKPEKTTAGA